MSCKYFILISGMSFIIDDEGAAGLPLCRDYGKINITFTPLVKIRLWMTQRTVQTSILSVYNITFSSLYSVISIPLCWPWTCTYTYNCSFFSSMVSFVFLLLSLPVSVTLSPFSHLSTPPPSQQWIQVSQFQLGHASCLQQSIRLLGKMASSLHRGPFHLDNLAPLP